MKGEAEAVESSRMRDGLFAALGSVDAEGEPFIGVYLQGRDQQGRLHMVMTQFTERDAAAIAELLTNVLEDGGRPRALAGYGRRR
jgi:hypothetical protein